MGSVQNHTAFYFLKCGRSEDSLVAFSQIDGSPRVVSVGGSMYATLVLSYS
jgi:hypothetical protein